MAHHRQGEEPSFRRMSKDIYNRIEVLSPGYLRKDVFKYAKTNNPAVETLQSFTDVELLKLKIAQLHVIPQSQRRILHQENGYRGSTQRNTIGLKFSVLRDPSSIAKYSSARCNLKPIWDLSSLPSTKFGGDP